MPPAEEGEVRAGSGDSEPDEVVLLGGEEETEPERGVDGGCAARQQRLWEPKPALLPAPEASNHQLRLWRTDGAFESALNNLGGFHRVASELITVCTFFLDSS